MDDGKLFEIKKQSLNWDRRICDTKYQEALEKLDMSAADLAELGIWLTVPWTVKMIFGALVDSV